MCQSSDMDEDANPKDIVSAAFRFGGEDSVWNAALRISHDSDDDVRMIAAQALVGNRSVSAVEIESWLATEPNGEVRGWLAVALAIVQAEACYPKLQEMFEDESREPLERLYLAAALAIASRSRRFLLVVMQGIFSGNKEISQASSSLARMLISEDAKTEIDFLDILVKEHAGAE